MKLANNKLCGLILTCYFPDVPSPPALLVESNGGNEVRAVPIVAVKEYAATVSAKVFVTSARTGYGVQASPTTLFVKPKRTI